MEIIAKLAFGVYTLIIVAGGVTAVAARGLVRALAGLIAAMAGVAGMYLLMAAPFVAFMQILIHVGGIGVLIFFAVMLTRAGPDGDESRPRSPGACLLALLVFSAPGIVLCFVVLKYPPESLSRPVDTGILGLGRGMLGACLLPFELVSIVLFVAMAGAVLVAWRKWGKK